MKTKYPRAWDRFLKKCSEDEYKKEKPKKEKTKKTNYFTAGSHGGIDDEYYINEIIGIEELPYEEFIKDKEVKKPSLRTDQHQMEFNFDE